MATRGEDLRMAVVAQHYRVPNPDPEVKYGKTGIYTLVGLVRDDARGWPAFQGFMEPHDPSSFPIFDVRDPGKPSYFVAVGLGRRLGWGLTPDKLTPLVFDDGSPCSGCRTKSSSGWLSTTYARGRALTPGFRRLMIGVAIPVYLPHRLE